MSRTLPSPSATVLVDTRQVRASISRFCSYRPDCIYRIHLPGTPHV
ncbi:hypothetical protein PMI40_01063 [Herbaspirillum sp. YR522]|nr:hypothetical protein PMI40_01063 [Herbaspirillum sp. YR522]